MLALYDGFEVNVTRDLAVGVLTRKPKLLTAAIYALCPGALIIDPSPLF